MEALRDLRELAQGLVHRRDPRVRNYAMQASPTVVVGAVLGYMLLVGYGPRFMKNRQTPPLRLVMFLYNIGQVWLSAYMLREFWVSRPANWGCSPVDVSEDPVSLRLVNACYIFHVSKIVDFLDTVFLVLKKDHKRMTYLHVYHHGSMVSGWWICTLFIPGGSCWIPGAVNSFVHCVMYSYYLLASLGPRVRPYLWWKRYLTQLQLAQFGLLLFAALFIQGPGIRCGMPAYSSAMTMSYVIVLSILFANFYVQSYSRGGKDRRVSSAASLQNGEVNGKANGKANGKMDCALNAFANGAVKSDINDNTKICPNGNTSHQSFFDSARRYLLKNGTGCFADQG
ncbi:elongation of very long chain fatty acids protein 1-like [Pollicipes pollicipes]|uniref:elongation of very long chain fatty acids protein 1-like n=1 Tax=Pollicipes pollicipes TaxID=41117 RepID=UPI001884C6BB|nr:elongation of very long chain fatty acids protein 1-like [Pollicipes pollicipes]